ncbi:T9SS type A sorting domain-containing protein, partial [bacterium]|nr:T9SS type A sorting domain-containing protein [bacterium]
PVMLVSPPSDFALTQNYPNPFNPETTINYQIAEESEVTIKVYSLLGREIKTLISKKLPAASYYAKWDGTDNFGQKVSSGIYLIQMKAGTFSQMRKMTLMR